jgi:hypothetical protein
MFAAIHSLFARANLLSIVCTGVGALTTVVITGQSQDPVPH